MPNLTALSNLARTAAPYTRAAAGPSPVAAVSGAVATGATVAQAGAAAAGLTGAAGALAAAVPILGIAAVAAPLIANVFSCGTISQVGCQKVSDSKALINARVAELTAAYSAETGTAPASQVIATLQQINQQAAGQFQNLQRSWLSPSTYYSVCGSFSNNGQAQTGPPCSSKAAAVIPSGSSVTGPQMTQNYINFVQSIAPATSLSTVGSSAVSAVSNALGSVTSTTGIPGWVVVAAAAAGLFFLAK